MEHRRARVVLAGVVGDLRLVLVHLDDGHSLAIVVARCVPRFILRISLMMSHLASTVRWFWEGIIVRGDRCCADGSGPRAIALRSVVWRGRSAYSSRPSPARQRFASTPPFSVVSPRSRFIAMRLSTDTFSAPSPFLTRDSSSRNATSSIQCSPFSICQ